MILLKMSKEEREGVIIDLIAPTLYAAEGGGSCIDAASASSADARQEVARSSEHDGTSVPRKNPVLGLASMLASAAAHRKLGSPRTVVGPDFRQKGAHDNHPFFSYYGLLVRVLLVYLTSRRHLRLGSLLLLAVITGLFSLLGSSGIAAHRAVFPRRVPPLISNRRRRRRCFRRDCCRCISKT